MNLASLWLRLGDFDRGLPEFGWRLKASPATPARDVPLWDGSGLQGKTIVLQAEQGLGDTLQFVRYASLIKQQGANVIVECQTVLVPLLSRLPWGVVIPKGAQWPVCDCYAPLMSLPRIMKTSLSSVPADVPYLSADPALIEHWRERLRGAPGLKIAIGWQGNPEFPEDRERSFPLA